MKRIILLLILFVFVLSCSNDQDADFSERTKIALRDAGNKLLLSSKDSTSLILPVKALSSNSYELAFSKPLFFEPNTLVSIISQSLKTSKLPEHYRVEVIQCSDGEVAYSYQMSANEESTIIPCADRISPKACYLIKVKFTNIKAGLVAHNIVLYAITLLALIGLGFLIFRKAKTTKEESESVEKLGSFYFYPEQNKLVKEAQEIALSKKECELLALFVANPNQIIKRDVLTKRVWEDNGVFVSRSLDTYISKLRKKLKSDTSIKLTNVHGVGYKLEV